MKSFFYILFSLLCFSAMAQDVSPDDVGARSGLRGVQVVRSGSSTTPTVTISPLATSASVGLVVNSVGVLSLQKSGINMIQFTSSNQTSFSVNTNSAAASVHWLFNAPSDLNQTLSTSVPLLSIGSSSIVTRQWATGTLADSPQELFYGIKDGFVGASTQTLGETLEVQQSDCGANGTCSTLAAIQIPTYAYTGTVTNGYGLYVAAPTGAGTINAAAYLGGIVGIGTANPKSELDVYGNVSIGTSYAGATAAPANGMIVQGGVSIGTSATPRNSATLDVNGSINAAGVIIRQAYTVSTLPSTAGTGKVTGAMAYVTDAVACTFLATLTGGGATYCPVGYNGTAWVGE